MDPQKAREEISSHVLVSRQSVALAKSFILSSFDRSSEKMLHGLLSNYDVHKPEYVVLHKSVDPLPAIRAVASALSWQLSFAKALWGLIGAALILPMQSNLVPLETSQAWTTVVPGSGGHTAAWQFKEYSAAVPAVVRKAPSLSVDACRFLSNSDLYIKELDIPSLHSEIEQALRDAVDCFRNELYLPCLAMLGLASEGAWIELGKALLDSCTDGPGLTAKVRQAKRDKLEDPYVSILEAGGCRRTVFTQGHLWCGGKGVGLHAPFFG